MNIFVTNAFFIQNHDIFIEFTVELMNIRKSAMGSKPPASRRIRQETHLH